MTNRKIIVTVVLGLISAGSVLASPVLYSPDLWTDAAATWTVSPVSPNDGFPSETGSGTHAGILFTGGGLTPAASLSATSGNFVGNLQNEQMRVSFGFNSVDMIPAQQQGALALYFSSTNNAGSTNTWYYDLLSSPTSTGVTPYSVFMGLGADSLGWGQIAGAGGADYWTDLATVIRFGFEIRGAASGVDQNYEIQDVQFTVPEPETVWMILMVLASLGITFRSRLMELAGQVKARIRA